MNLMDQLTNELGTYHFIANLANAFFCIDIAPEGQDQFACTWEGQQWIFTVLRQGYLHSPTTSYGLVVEDLAEWPHATEVHLFHYIDDVWLTSDSFSELEKTVPQALSHLKSCDWAVKEAKLQCPGLSFKFLGVVWTGKTKVIPN